MNLTCLFNRIGFASPVPYDDSHLPIAIRKGTRSCTQHPVANHVYYDYLMSLGLFPPLCLLFLFHVVYPKFCFNLNGEEQ